MNEKELYFIGQNIRKWRKAQKLTHEQLALRFNRNQRNRTQGGRATTKRAAAQLPNKNFAKKTQFYRFAVQIAQI